MREKDKGALKDTQRMVFLVCGKEMYRSIKLPLDFQQDPNRHIVDILSFIKDCVLGLVCLYGFCYYKKYCCVLPYPQWYIFE